MNAPDKIYVFQHGFNAFDPLWHFTESKEKHTESHEYIRKDALLEWAKECSDSFNEQMKDLKQTDIAYRVLCGGLSTIELLLNKLNSL